MSSLDADPWEPSPHRHTVCSHPDKDRRCDKPDVWIRWRYPREGGTDIDIHCRGCGYRHTVDGPDA